jgi:hypothetical protein
MWKMEGEKEKMTSTGEEMLINQFFLKLEFVGFSA